MEIWVGAGPDVGCRSKTQCRGMFVGRDKKMVGQVCRLGDDAFEFLLKVIVIISLEKGRP